MNYTLKYGNQQINFTLAEKISAHCLQPEIGSHELITETEVIQQALEAPLNSLPLEKIVRKGEKTCIVVPDRTRVCQAAVFLPIIIERLNQCGINQQDITILMANGTHRKNTPAEEIEILGEAIFKQIKVIEHDCHDLTTLIHLGETEAGTPIYINRALVRAERVIVTGGVLHHYFAGFGGGPKLIVPGCAGYETILHNHRFTIHPFFPALQPGCQEGNLADNPVYLDLQDALKFVTVDFSLNVVLDEKGLINQAFAGELGAAHQAACTAVNRLHTIPFRQKADLVIASGGGYPKDLNLIQVHKALHHAFNTVKEGGILILLAQCRDGIGSQTFLEWFDGEPTRAMMHQNLLHHFKINGNTALALKMKTDAAHIILISALDENLVRKLGMTPAQSIKAALDLAYSQLTPQFDCIVIPDAAAYLPLSQIHPLEFDQNQKEKLINAAIQFVKERTETNFSGHDWWHAWRVWQLAKRLTRREGGNPLIIELAALLHDLEDWKKTDTEQVSPKTLVYDWLRLKQLPKAMIDAICEIIQSLSFKGAGVKTEMKTLEGKIVQDADRLDAMGAIGIARTFAYGAEIQRPIYLPDLPAQYHLTAEDYQSNKGTSINHFYEKLLLLKARLNTATAQRIGQKRHDFLQTYLQQFLKEWNGEDIET